jgi:hypothetical protein
MGAGSSLVVIGIGAILDFAVTEHTSGFNINKIGLILMVVGGIGLLLSLVFWSSWGGFGRSRRVTTIQSPGAGAVGYDQAPGTVGAPQATRYVQEEHRI